MIAHDIAQALLAAPTPPPIPNPGGQLPDGLSDAAGTLISWAKGILYLAGFLGLLAAAIMMAAGARNRSQLAADGAARIPWVMGSLVLGSIAFLLTGTFVI